MNKKWLSCIAMGLVLVTGCGEDPQPPQAQGNAVTHNNPEARTPDAGQLAYGLLGPGPANYGSLFRQPPAYDHPGEINTGTSFKSLHRERRHLGNDEALIHHIIEDEHGMDAGIVIIAGHHAFVNVTPPAGLNEEDKKKEMDKLNRALRKEIPRYEVHVSERNA
ncbi:hypothetical protein [Halalkalibacter alkaliphilus]|uniref:Uncharacterized protein n=1 Tax=Halalkalibacter alkaliphilus TaxID=2917993 RepID=A0A9X2CSS0_9BACI|nr:hypothetical protein [Halalkalibacter alkaliphilus]MCL7747615.1 hypothetical protein [Halalkalibacter alkaliphilus]